MTRGGRWGGVDAALVVTGSTTRASVWGRPDVDGVMGGGLSDGGAKAKMREAS